MPRNLNFPNSVFQLFKQLMFDRIPTKYMPSKIKDDRYRRAAYTSITLVTSQVLTILAGLITIPFLARYLGGDLFGLWMVLNNFVSFLIFLDFGIGVGFQNQLIRCFANNNKNDPGIWMANALLVMLIMALFLVVIALHVAPDMPWNDWLALSSPQERLYVLPSVQAFLISFAFGLPAMLLQYIGNAYQRGYFVYGLLACGRFISVVGLIIACVFELGLPYLIVIYVGIPNFLSVLGLLILWYYVPWFRPRISQIKINKLKQLFQVGIGMVGVRVTHAFAIQGPAYVVTFYQGLAAAGIIAVIQKILIIPSICTQSLLVATQGAMGEAAHKKEWIWVKRNLIKLTKLNILLYFFATVISVIFGGKGLAYILGGINEIPGRSLILLLCIYFALTVIRFPFSSFLTVIDRVYTQSIYRIITLSCTYILVSYYNDSLFIIIIIFLAAGEVPTFMCTFIEACWVILKGEKNLKGL